jgi:hypothetical protein
MSGLSLTLPEGRDRAWTEEVLARFDLSLRRLARALDAPVPEAPVTTEGDVVVLAAGGTEVRLMETHGTDALARRLGDTLSRVAWPAILAPALAARGVAESWWLRHAALRGLTLGELTALAVDAADEETIAWRLADRHPPRLTLRAGAEALAILGDDALRARAAQDAAFWSGLPIPIPPAPVADAMRGQGEAALSLGVLPMPGFAREADGAWRAPLAKALRHAAPALVDPALALAMVTDEGRIPRRHGALALARTGAAGIARSIAAVIEDAFGMVDMAAIVDEAAGIAPENALFQ